MCPRFVFNSLCEFDLCSEVGLNLLVSFNKNAAWILFRFRSFCSASRSVVDRQLLTFLCFRQRKVSKRKRPHVAALRVPVCTVQKMGNRRNSLRFATLHFVQTRPFLIHFLPRTNGSASSGCWKIFVRSVTFWICQKIYSKLENVGWCWAQRSPTWMAIIEFDLCSEVLFG